MLPKRKNELATELKDLDVDRVDGVDRPATGRAFVVSKRAFRLFPESVSKSEQDPFIMKIRAEIEKNVRECLIKRVYPDGDWFDWKVKGEDTFTLFKGDDEAVARDEAIEFIVKCTIGPMIKGYYDDKPGTPNGMGGGAMDNAHPSQRMADQMRGPNFPGSVQAPLSAPDSLGGHVDPWGPYAPGGRGGSTECGA